MDVLTWTRKYYDKLIGMRIVGVSYKEEDGEVWVTAHARVGNEAFDLEFSCDEEGNRPGFVFGLPAPTTKEIHGSPADTVIEHRLSYP